MRSDPDHALVAACQESQDQGFHGAFRELYELYKDRVYNVCYRITGHPSDALDASQETFGILFRKIREFRFQSKFSSWVYRIAINVSIDQRRRTASRPQPASLDAITAEREDRARVEFDDESCEPPPVAASRSELEDEIQAAITRLSPKMRAITVLRYTEGLSYEEIAAALNISLGTVKSRLSRAHAALDRELTPILDRHSLR